MGYYDKGWGRYVSVAERHANARKMAKSLKAQGYITSPVMIEGRKIARTFWGKAWCEHLESYSDYANRLPRGKRYIRNGSVFDLQIKPGTLEALVTGTEIYKVQISIKKVSEARWGAIREACAGQIGSLVDLLQGRLDEGVMGVLVDRQSGLFPAPREISLSCSCPDWADMCKHVAAALYGVGSRLDSQPELLFRLRGVDEADLLTGLAEVNAFEEFADLTGELDEDDLSALFDIELEGSLSVPTPALKPATSKRRGRKKASGHSTGKTRGQKSIGEDRVTIAARELTAQGIAHNRIQYWLRTGVLERSGRRGVYYKTAQTDVAVRAHLGQEQVAPARVVARELTAQGIPHAKIQYWLRTGVLEHSGERGVYLETLYTKEKVKAFLQSQ